MSVAVAAVRPTVQRTHSHARWVIARFIAGRSMRGAAIWGFVFGIWVIGTIKAFLAGYPTIASRLQVARSLGAFSMFLGYPRRLETVAGFATWRVLVVIVTISAIWGLMVSTGLLRGEEDAGRWEMVVASPVSRGRATAQALIGIAASLLVMFAITGVMIALASRMPGARFSVAEALLFALAAVSGAAMFVSLGALLSQISATRGQALTLGGLAVAAAYVLRMVADANTSLGWLRWLTPIGWLEELQPLHEPQPLALIPVVALVVSGSAAAVVLAQRRDLNASILRESEGGLQLAGWLIGPVSLTLRVTGVSALAWLGATCAMGIVYGSLTRTAASLMSSSSLFATAFSRLGIRQVANGYLGVVFLMMAVLISFIAASQIAGIRDEEASGRLDNLLVRPVSRLQWLLSRLCISLSIVLLAGAGCGLFVWIGAASQHTGVLLSKLLEAGLNATVPGVFVIGAGCLVLGLRPRLTSMAAYGIVAWSFLMDLLGSLVKGNDLLRDSSLFTHIKLAPAATPDWQQNLVLVAIGVAATLIGAVLFVRRDVEYT